MNFIKSSFTVLAISLMFLLSLTADVSAQTSVSCYSYIEDCANSAPNTQKVVNDCLSSCGVSISCSQTCAQAGADYLNTHGYPGATTNCVDPTKGCEIACTNGSFVDLPPVPTQPPPAPPVITQSVPTPAQPTVTPPQYNPPTFPPYVPPSGPVCGNFSCELGETCTVCPNDCGACPVQPTATPQATATPTTVPACNAFCTSSSYCQNAKDGCTQCLPNPNGNGKTCQPPAPTATPTSKPSATPTATATPSPTATLTPTPTPLPFDESMCKCDGLDSGRIALGVPLKITAYGKVEGENTNYAKVTAFKFLFISGNDPTKQVTIKEESVNTTQIQDTASLDRYQADWTLDLPTTLDTSTTYRIKATPVCSRKSAAVYNVYPTTAVMAAQTSKPQGLWASIVSFFVNLFGGGNQNVKNVAGPTATPTLTAGQRQQIQLQTIVPAEGIEKDNCTFIKFNF